MQFETSQVLLAFALTLFAGLATGIGSLVAFVAKRTNTKFLSFSLGFSAGVMVYISFMELVPEAGKVLNDLQLVLSFFGGIGLIAIIDFLIPEDENPHEIHLAEDMEKNVRLKRMGIMIALSIAIHNFPEGVAAFMSGMNSLDVGIPIALAIAIHNIPEGIAVALPIYYSTKSKKKAFGAALLSGMVEPVGAVVGFLLLQSVLNNVTLGILLAAVAGIMVYISFDELLPMAREYGNGHIEIIGVSLGMLVMAVSLVLL